MFIEKEEILLNNDKEQVIRLNVADTFFYFSATCLRDGVEVQKSTVKCEVKSGCRLIQKTGECCPEYQCGKN